MKPNIGLRYVLIDAEEPEWYEPIGRVFDLTINDLRVMIDVLDHLDDMPEGFTLGIQAVRRKVPQTAAEREQRLLQIFARRRGLAG